VVKNAAGFDQHKLMIGSLGRLGVLVELRFKVFPKPPAYGTLRVDVADAAAGVAVLRRLATTRFDLEALDLRLNDPTLSHAAGANGSAGAAVLVRLGGHAAVLPQRLQMLAAWLGAGAVDAAAEAEYWRAGDSFAWLPGGAGTSRSTSSWSLVKTPITLDRLAVLDEMLAAHGAARRYSSGGNLAWIGWPRDLGDLDRRLADFSLGGLVVLGNTDAPLIGVRRGQNLAQRVKATLDPNHKFLALA
jgi:glycolate oxidase FAD binding subunit